MSLNDSLKGLPTHQATVSVALIVILSAGLSEVGRLVFKNIELPDAFWYFFAAMSGFSLGGLVTKRVTDYGRVALRHGASIQDVTAAQQIRDTGTYPVPVPAPEVQKPSALAQRLASTSGEHPVEPSIREVLKDYAEKQKDAAADKDDEGII